MLWLAVLALIATACGGASEETTTTPPASTTTTSIETTTAAVEETSTTAGEASGEPIKIGAVLGISGRFAFVGGPQQNALLMAQDEINAAGGIAGRPVEFTIYDDEVDETKTVPLVNRLISEDGVVAVIGPSITIPALAVGPIFEREQVPNITLTSRAIWEQDNLTYVYQTTPREEVEVLSLISFIKEDLGLTKVGVLYDSQPYGTGNLAFIEQFAPDLGLEVVATESIENADTNAVPQLERLRDAGVEVLIIWVGDPAASSAVKGADQIGWDIPMIGSSAIAGPTFIELGGESAEGVYSDATFNFGDPPPNQAAFLDNYQAEYGSLPTQFASFAYDAAYALKAAIESAGGDTSADAIIGGLNDMPALDGVTATFDFSPEDHNGLGLNPLFYIVQVQNGQYAVVADTRTYAVNVGG
jgi:branched-chain amino acid transport system substrate-binding protein